MPARKPRALNRRHDTATDAAARAAAEESMTPARKLPARPPARLDGHELARAAWRRLLREFGELEAELVTRLDLDLLVDYCLLLEQAAELDDLRAAARALWLQLSQANQALVKEGKHDEAVLLALKVMDAFDAVVKLDGRVDRKRALLLQWRQSLYLTPRARAGAAPKTKTPPEEDDEFTLLLKGAPRASTARESDGK